MATETDILLLSDDLRQLVDAAEERGNAAPVRAERGARAAQLRSARDRRGLPRARVPRDRRDPESTRTASRSLAPAGAAAAADLVGDDDRCAQLFLREAGRHPLLTAAQEVELAKRIEARTRCQAADDPVQPPARRLDREELPQPGPAVPRPDPGGHARPDPRRREVRLAPRLQVLDLRHLVDPAGGRARARRQGADDPDAGPHRRADAEDEPRRAAALGAARPRADARGDRRRGEPAAQQAKEVKAAARASTASTRRSATPTTRCWAISSPARAAAGRAGRGLAAPRRRSRTRCTRCRTATGGLILRYGLDDAEPKTLEEIGRRLG